MRVIDVRNLIRFNTRMGMYVCPSHRANVVAFLHGYEYGASDECRFTKALGELLLSSCSSPKTQFLVNSADHGRPA
jgi:hypothetical protein